MLLFLTIYAKENNTAELDEGLLEKIAEGSMEAFESLYWQTEKQVYSYIFSIVKNQEDAKDIMQETYLKIRAGAHLYQPKGKPLAWILTIAKNLCYMKFRENKKRADCSWQDMENDRDFSYLEDTEDRMVMQSLMMVLSEEERQIVILKAVSGMKHREIASFMGLGLSSVLSKYNRALKKLKNFMEKEGYLS